MALYGIPIFLAKIHSILVILLLFKRFINFSKDFSLLNSHYKKIIWSKLDNFGNILAISSVMSMDIGDYSDLPW